MTTNAADEAVAAQLKSWGWMGNPGNWAPVGWQGLISSIRAVNLGVLPFSALGPLLKAVLGQSTTVTPTDVALTAPVQGTFGMGGSVRDIDCHAMDGDNGLPNAAARWSFGDGATGSGVNVGHTYVRAGKYPVTLTVSMAGQMFRSTQEVTI